VARPSDCRFHGGVPIVRLLAPCGGLTVLAGLHAAIAVAVGAATRRHPLAVAIAATVAVAGYLLGGLPGTSANLAWPRPLSPWQWLHTRNVLVYNPAPLPLVAQTLAVAASSPSASGDSPAAISAHTIQRAPASPCPVRSSGPRSTAGAILVPSSIWVR
jgi:hypothetical protein